MRVPCGRGPAPRSAAGARGSPGPGACGSLRRRWLAVRFASSSRWRAIDFHSARWGLRRSWMRGRRESLTRSRPRIHECRSRPRRRRKVDERKQRRRHLRYAPAPEMPRPRRNPRPVKQIDPLIAMPLRRRRSGDAREPGRTSGAPLEAVVGGDHQHRSRARSERRELSDHAIDELVIPLWQRRRTARRRQASTPASGGATNGAKRCPIVSVPSK